MKKYHCKTSIPCLSCDYPIHFESYSEEKETLQELVIRVIREALKLRDLHSKSPYCLKKIKIKAYGRTCSMCDEDLSVERTYNSCSKDDIKKFEINCAREVMGKQFSHSEICLKVHTQTRVIIFEKCQSQIK